MNVTVPELSQMTATVLGSSVKADAVAHGIQSGLRFLSLIVGGAGLLVTALLARSAATKPAPDWHPSASMKTGLGPRVPWHLLVANSAT